jgi:hypothetical protein
MYDGTAPAAHQAERTREPLLHDKMQSRQLSLRELRSVFLRISAGLGSYLNGDDLAEDVPRLNTISPPGVHECVFHLFAHEEHCAQRVAALTGLKARLRDLTLVEATRDSTRRSKSANTTCG